MSNNLYALIPLGIAFVGYSLQNISQATQKIGLGTMQRDRRKGLLIWLLATVGTGSSALILLVAVSLGTVALVGAMAGTGLIAVTVYSRLVMSERIGRRELTGVLLILSAAILIGASARVSAAAAIAMDNLFVMFALVVGGYVSVWLLLRRRGKGLGVVIGGFSGALGGFVTQFQKVSTSGPEASGLLARIANPYTLLWIVLSMSAMIVLQFAYKHDQAIRIIPAFSANYILVPVFGGLFCFGDTLRPIQWLGVAAILAGVLVLTIKPKQTLGAPTARAAYDGIEAADGTKAVEAVKGA